AWEFVKYISSHDPYVVMMAQAPGRVPTRASLLAEYLELQRVNWGLDGNRFLPAHIHRARNVPRHPEMNRIRDLINQVLMPVWRNEEVAANAARELDRQLDLLLSRN